MDTNHDRRTPLEKKVLDGFFHIASARYLYMYEVTRKVSRHVMHKKLDEINEMPFYMSPAGIRFIGWNRLTDEGQPIAPRFLCKAPPDGIPSNAALFVYKASREDTGESGVGQGMTLVGHDSCNIDGLPVSGWLCEGFKQLAVGVFPHWFHNLILEGPFNPISQPRAYQEGDLLTSGTWIAI